MHLKWPHVRPTCLIMTFRLWLKTRKITGHLNHLNITMTVFLRKCFFTFSIHKFISWKYVGIQQVEFNVATMHKLSVKMFISWNSWSMWVNLSFEEKKHRRKCPKYKNNERFLSWENNYLQSWDGWLYIELGRVRFQGEVEVSFDSRI